MEILVDGRPGRVRRVADHAIVVRFQDEQFDRWLFLDTLDLLWNQGKVRFGKKLPIPKRWLWSLGLWRDRPDRDAA